MPKTISATEAEFLKILATPADRVGNFSLSNLDYAKFSRGLELYIALANSNERSRKTSADRKIVAEQINDVLVEAQQIRSELRPPFLYKKLNSLLQSKVIKRSGRDGKSSQLYLLIEGYLSWYYYRIIVPTSNPKNLADDLKTLSEALCPSDKSAIAKLVNTLSIFQPACASASKVQTAFNNSLVQGDGQDVRDNVVDQAVRQAYKEAAYLFHATTFKNSILKEKLLNFCCWYELEVSNYSYSQKRLINEAKQQRQQSEQSAATIQELNQKLAAAKANLAEIEEQCKVQETQIGNTQIEQNRATANLAKFKAENEELCKKVAEQKVALEHKAKDLTQAQFANEKLTASEKTLTSSLASKTTAVDTLQAQLKQQASKVQTQQTSLMNAEKKANDLQVEHIALATDNAKIKAENQLLAAELDRRVAKQTKALSEENEKLKEENQLLTNAAAENLVLEQQIKALTTEVVELRHKLALFDAPQSALHKSEESLAATVAKLQALEAEKKQLESVLSEKVEKIKTQKALLAKIREFLIGLLTFLKCNKFSESKLKALPCAVVVDEFLFTKDFSHLLQTIPILERIPEGFLFQDEPPESFFKKSQRTLCVIYQGQVQRFSEQQCTDMLLYFSQLNALDSTSALLKKMLADYPAQIRTLLLVAIYAAPEQYQKQVARDFVAKIGAAELSRLGFVCSTQFLDTCVTYKYGKVENAYSKKNPLLLEFLKPTMDANGLYFFWILVTSLINNSAKEQILYYLLQHGKNLFPSCGSLDDSYFKISIAKPTYCQNEWPKCPLTTTPHEFWNEALLQHIRTLIADHPQALALFEQQFGALLAKEEVANNCSEMPDADKSESLKNPEKNIIPEVPVALTMEISA